MSGDTNMDSDDHQGMNVDSTAQAGKPDLREISIILDSWSRTCDTLLTTIEAQINKITK